MKAGDQERAWERHVVLRERTGARITAALVMVLFPAWSLFDYWLEPAYANRFLVIRLAVGAFAAAMLLIRRSPNGMMDRLATVVLVLIVGINIAYFISLVDHITIYTIGFSLIFWGFGLLLVWPWAYMVSCFALTIGIHVVFWLASNHSDLESFLGLLAYLISAAAISTGVSIARRRLEHQAFIASYELEDKNRALATALATLKAAQERLVATEKLSALGRLIAQLSHEINNPVNVLQNNLEPLTEYLTTIEQVLEIARRQCSDPSGELARSWSELEIDFVRTDMREALSSMAAAAERIRTIQNDLRAFMRGDAALPIEADFNAGVRSTVAMLKRTLGPKTVLFETYGELPPARVHTGQINQVTMNLLQNALDVVGASGRIEIETRAEPDGLVLSVADTGPGVSEAAKRHLFEPFFTTKDVGKGTGLGLATCYQIVRAHGGTITLDEGYRNGARFVVKLPFVAG